MAATGDLVGLSCPPFSRMATRQSRRPALQVLPEVNQMGDRMTSQNEQQDSNVQGHAPGCPCNNADERGCFLISAETGKCVSCTCDRPADSGPERQHLPECRKPLCDWSDPDSWECLGYGDCDHICICAELLACQKRERDLWERVAAERIRDLMSCHKPDDCHARADSIEVLLDDVAYYREGRP